MQENKPILIVGLGNPDAKYSNTRHNVGFMALDMIAGSDVNWKAEKNALLIKTAIHAAKTVIRVYNEETQKYYDRYHIQKNQSNEDKD